MRRACPCGFRALFFDRRGTPALEFALIAPLFFTAIMITFELGHALYERNRVAAALSLGVRAATVAADEREKAAVEAIQTKLSDIDADAISIDFEKVTFGQQVMTRVSVSYTHDFLIKFGKHFSDWTLSAAGYVKGPLSFTEDDCGDPLYASIAGLLEICGGVDLGGGVEYDLDAVVDDGISVSGGLGSGKKGGKSKK